MAHRQYRDENWYKATWAHRVWFAGGCTTFLISLFKSILLISKLPFTPRTYLPLPLSAVLGYLLADLASGIVHWAFDNYGSARTPIFGPQIQSFLEHHQRPVEITKCETAGTAHTLAAAATVAITPLNLFNGDPSLLAFAGVFAACSMFSVKFHAWAHLPRKKLPPLVAALQDAGILLGPSRHAPHHRPPYKGNYCTVSGIWNRALDKSKVLPCAETALFYLTGVGPRWWSEVEADQWTQRTQMGDKI
ncbi:hypothetical protein CASFOL_014923 [Castilleja foliolosa]|uniref:Lipid desaturase domain-containing protein n=1 Tax=Castilleja foliolosa TaxID=1961234 RepID=A0ABD3DGH3_9LAMI